MKATELQYKLYVDLDGVMANLEKFVFELTGHWLTDNDQTDQHAWEQFHALEKGGRPSYSAFEMMPDAQELWDYVKKYKPTILTATGPEYEHATKEKTSWVQKHLSGHGDIITVNRSRKKAKHATPTSILIDDRMVSIGPWTNAGGIGILHTSAHDTITQLQQLEL
jgi:hypothetical protein